MRPLQEEFSPLRVLGRCCYTLPGPAQSRIVGAKWASSYKTVDEPKSQLARKPGVRLLPRQGCLRPWRILRYELLDTGRSSGGAS